MTVLPGQRPTLETAFDLIRATKPKLSNTRQAELDAALTALSDRALESSISEVMRSATEWVSVLALLIEESDRRQETTP